MYFLIQENLYNNRNEANLLEALNRMDCDYCFFKHVPFTNELIFDNDNLPKNSFLFGSVRAVQICKDYTFNPGSFHNENHDYEVYSLYYGSALLNCGASIRKFGDDIMENFFFCRPTEDTKTFTGKLFTNSEWKEFVEKSLTSGHTTTLNKDTPVMIYPPVQIYQEVRCFIVNQKVVSASFYKIGSQVIYKECLDGDIIEFAEKMADEFQLADAFVMDICRTENGLKIVECGCINCAGFYDINIQKLIYTLNKQFSI